MCRHRAVHDLFFLLIYLPFVATLITKRSSASAILLGSPTSTIASSTALRRQFLAATTSSALAPAFSLAVRGHECTLCFFLSGCVSLENALVPSFWGLWQHPPICNLQPSPLFPVGSTKILQDGMRLRGDINVLLLGDPGTAKSQMLKFAEQVSLWGVADG